MQNLFSLHAPIRVLSLGLVALSLGVLPGCATGLEPQLPLTPVVGFDLVDLKSLDQPKYAADYAECAKLGNQEGSDLTRAAVGALNVAADRASFGIIGGAGASKNADRVTVLKRCLTGRGYTVLR